MSANVRTCLACIAYLEKELQCDIDEWMPDDDDIPQILCPSNLKEAVPHADVDERMLDHDDMPRITLSSSYIGRRIRKRFCRKWYTGIITAFDPDDKLYHAKYDDDDSEDLDHNEMHKCLISFEKHWSQQQLAKQRKHELQRRRRNVSRAINEQLERTQRSNGVRRIRRNVVQANVRVIPSFGFKYNSRLHTFQKTKCCMYSLQPWMWKHVP
jgi:hypothetical protein